MTIEAQCAMIYRTDNFVRQKLLPSRFRVLQALGAFGIQLLMGFCYATVLQVGYKELHKRKGKR